MDARSAPLSPPAASSSDPTLARRFFLSFFSRVASSTSNSAREDQKELSPTSLRAPAQSAAFLVL